MPAELHSVHESLRHLLVPITDLQQHPRNPREHDEDVLRESLILNGMYAPVIFQRSTGRLLAGNGTWAACLSLGWTHIAGVGLDVDDDEALRILLVDNRVHEKGKSEPEKLLDLLRSLEGEFGGSGYTASDFTDLMSVVDAAAVSLAGAPPRAVSDTPGGLVVSGDLRSLTLGYTKCVFENLVRDLSSLQGEGETFTDVVMRLVAQERATP